MGTAPALAQTNGSNRGLRIGVVGGGPAGLSAAHRLQKAGFAHVTVLERNSEVGGKTETVAYQGHNYEMGAIMSGPSYDEVIALAAEMNEKIVPFSPGGASVVEADPFQSQMKTMPITKKIRFLAAAVEYYMLYRKFAKAFAQPGLINAPAELNEPFASWIKKNAHYHNEIQELLSHSFVSFGYGYMSEVPAAYVFRYFSPRLLKSFMFGQVRMIENGYQNLWKKVASRLDVSLNFDVADAVREGNEWRVLSKNGESKNFDVLIWTAPLDAAKVIRDLSPELKDVFSKIRYQFYNSSLVEVENLPRGSGVVLKNYEAARSGNVVSWLYRWPNKTNVANFYTLSDTFMTPESVEAGLQSFAGGHGFKIKKVVENRGWKYFPHFGEDDLDSKAYQLIESEQGKGGLYFAGEIMNFSTVEHSAEYSRDLVERNFINEKKLSVEVPADYTKMTARQKIEFLWNQVLSSEYRKRPTYAEASGSLWKELRGFLPSQLSKAFNNNNDVIEAGREKIIHKLGSTAVVEFVPHDGGYNPFDAIIRLSNAVDGSGGTMYPSFSIKIPVEGADRSINFAIGKSFDGQHIGNDPKAKPDFNFFRDDKLYPFSNELPLEPKSGFGKAFKWVFDRAHYAPNYIPVDEMTKVMNKRAPRRFIFKAPPEIRDRMSSTTYTDERAVFAEIPVGSVLFQVFESNGLGDPGRYVGDLKMTTRFVASRFGDQNLYFRHEGRGLKKPQADFSLGEAPGKKPFEKKIARRSPARIATCEGAFGLR